MKAKFLPVALAIFSLVTYSRSLADSTRSEAGIDEGNPIGLLSPRTSVNTTANVGSGTFLDGNHVALEADPNILAVFEIIESSSAPVNLLRMTFNAESSGIPEIQSGDASRHSRAVGLFRVPEPTTIALFFAGVGTLLLFRRRRRRFV
ncbi:PEP-CTERM protein-sorting domain-containing protein [Terrimicrobium sacchariphilum]|uniref:PEP-CTERM protein-sorting domain-containing protein n=1 Tax=Terrimicrobium sacchariphilum TaxID=690879 RepID=A0A146GC97_TERSA|nr:PEP-CTERM sorting domain-containing protein [Terrimicrobium sacchariphilum]GAT34327.1 PEP-CTERM protein-sorting domain-containing protein [Terrimicrobium sacchariphilum]